MDRENHKVLNNKWIKINEKWDLGSGIYAECPHDPDLPASETVRCSCLTNIQIGGRNGKRE